MKRYDIVTAKKYMKNGEEKTQWNNVGSLVYFPETPDKKDGYVIELNMFPETKFMVFKKKPKEGEAQKPEGTRYVSEEGNEVEIPF